MKAYASIGKFKGSNNIVSVAMLQTTKAAFTNDLYGNGFMPFVVVTEPMLAKLLACEDSMEIYEIVKKMTTNYSVWDDVVDYIEQCADLLVERVEKAKADVAVTYERFLEIAKQEYTRGGDGLYECWDEEQFKAYGPMTEQDVYRLCRL